MNALILAYSPDERNLLEQSLENIDMTLHFAEDVDAAMETLKMEENIDYILLDYRIPIMDGLKFIREIRKEALAETAEIITLNRHSKISQLMDIVQRKDNPESSEEFAPEQLIRDIYSALEEDDDIYMQRTYGERAVREMAPRQN